MLQYEFLLFAALALAGVLLSRKRFVEALLILFWAQASLSSVRHVPIFVIVVAPILVRELSHWWDEWARFKTGNSVVGILRDLASEFGGKSLRLTVWLPLVVLGLGISMASSKGGDTKDDIWPSEFPKLKFPIAMIDKYA